MKWKRINLVGIEIFLVASINHLREFSTRAYEFSDKPKIFMKKSDRLLVQVPVDMHVGVVPQSDHGALVDLRQSVLHQAHYIQKRSAGGENEVEHLLLACWNRVRVQHLGLEMGEQQLAWRDVKGVRAQEHDGHLQLLVHLHSLLRCMILCVIN